MGLHQVVGNALYFLVLTDKDGDVRRTVALFQKLFYALAYTGEHIFIMGILAEKFYGDVSAVIILVALLRYRRP